MKQPLVRAGMGMPPQGGTPNTAGKTTRSSGRAPVYKEQADPREPKMNELREDFLWAVDQRDTNVFRRQRLNYDARNCIWAAQSDDGRKWEPRRGEDTVFPWTGASDARVPLVDLYVNKDAAMLTIMAERMPIMVRPTEVNDAGFATTATSVLKWMLYEQMTERRTENRLLANYLCERGSAVMGVFWDRRQQLGYEEIDLEGVMNRIMTELQSNPNADARLQDLPHMLLNPAFDDESAKIAADFYPNVAESRLKKVIQDLRKDGFAKFPNPYTVCNRPRYRAYALNQDIFLPPEMTSMDDARNCHVRELITEARLRDRIKSYGWDRAWVEEVIDTQRGKITYGEDYLGSKSRLLGSRLMQNYEKLFEILHSYRRLTDEEGVPAIYYTCWNVNMTESWAYHDLLNYDHGEMPLVLVEREKRSRRVDDSRGYGEVASTWQAQIKAEWDMRVDRSTIATLPPSYYPPGQMPDKWGPGVQVPAMNPDKYGFFKTPEYDPGSKEVEGSVRGFSDEYFGRSKNPVDASDNKLIQQDLADTWVFGQKQILGQTFGLMQQFMPDDFFYSVVKDQQARPVHTSRDQIQGKFSIGVSYDVANLDKEEVEKKMAAMETVLNMDVNGLIDRDGALKVAINLMDPNLGEILLKPGEEASQGEIDDEQTVFVKLMAGIPVNVKPGQAYQLRLNVLKQLFAQNQEAQQLYQKNPQVQQAFEQRGKQLMLQIQQRQNAVIGRGGPNFAPKTLSRG